MVRKYVSICQNCGGRTGADGPRLCRACYVALPRFTKEQRFWAKVNKSEDCWEWTGYRTGFGYGELQSGPRGDQVKESAHRLSWEIHNGPIPDGLNVLHRCDNPPCVRPDHLFLGTASDNARDMWDKGRGPRGQKNGHAKLTDEAVAIIRERIAAGERPTQIALVYGVSEATVRDAASGRNWRHVA